MAMSKASLCFLIAVAGNALEVLVCLPLTRVPYGSGIKPMTLPLLFIVIAAASFALCRQVVKDATRPDGSKLLGGVAVLLCLASLPVGVITMHLIAALRDLTFG
jgi:hypothetical protein